MREFAEGFYKSKTWQKCRDGFVKQKRGLCERCLERGLYKPGEIVHHKTHITPENINDPDITLNWDNLMLLCRECHADAHKRGHRWKVDAYGHVTARA